MLYDIVEQVYIVAAANLVTDLTALAAAKSVTITTSVNIVKRQNADTFVQLGLTLPGLGIQLERATTQAKSQAQRETIGSVVFDYYAEDANAVKLAKQTELVAEALLLTIDRLALSGGGLVGAAFLPNSVAVELHDGYESGAQVTIFWRRALVRCPVYDYDTGL